MSWFHRFALLVLALFASGCASTYYHTYQEANPGWFPTVPSPGASLHEVLAFLYAPPQADYSRLISKLDVIRLGEGGEQKLDEPQIQAALAGSTGDLVVIANQACRSEVDLKRYAGEKVGWFLLRDGKLLSYDTFEFGHRCVVANDFRPADASAAATEARIAAYAERHFPTSMAHVGEFYRKGLAYLRVERIADAERMLAAGDGAHDVGSRGERRIHFEGPSRSSQVTDAAGVERFRMQLVKALERRRNEAGH